MLNEQLKGLGKPGTLDLLQSPRLFKYSKTIFMVVEVDEPLEFD
jgi:hypothetical protein